MGGPLDGQELFAMPEVCKILSLSESSVRKLIKDNVLAEGHKVPGINAVRWFRLDLENCLDRIRRAPPPTREESGDEE